MGPDHGHGHDIENAARVGVFGMGQLFVASQIVVDDTDFPVQPGPR